MKSSRGRRALIAAAIALALLSPAVTLAASAAHSEMLRHSFERQFWADARYPDAEVIGRWEGFGRIVAEGGAHCDLAAQGVYGSADDYEAIEEHYAGRTLLVGAAPPLALDVQPVSDRALSAEPSRTNDPDAAARDVLVRTHTDLARARSFRTVYVVQAVSWGHPAWLDWRCR